MFCSKQVAYDYGIGTQPFQFYACKYKLPCAHAAINNQAKRYNIVQVNAIFKCIVSSYHILLLQNISIL